MELARRWVAALMLIPQSEREGVVSAIEREIVEQYGGAPPSLTVVSPPVQRRGYVEQTHTTYEATPSNEPKAAALPRSKRSRRA